MILTRVELIIKVSLGVGTLSSGMIITFLLAAHSGILVHGSRSSHE